VVEQEVITLGIRMSRRVEPIFVTRQETIVLPRAKSIIAQGVLMVVSIKYSELIFNQQNGNIV